MNADRIFVFDAGALIESGTHQELVKQHGFYYDLFRKQLSLS
jgi:ABC-type multidrug transport system fused ATPase/permease subunit